MSLSEHSPPPDPGSSAPEPPLPPRRKKPRQRDFLAPPPEVPLMRRREMQSIVGFGLLAMMLIVFALMFKGTTPRVLDKVFDP